MQDSNPLSSTDSMIGKLLVASTSVEDPILNRSVCLVVHQDSENVFAVLLNRPMATPPGLTKLFGGQSPAGSEDAAAKFETRGGRLPGISDESIPKASMAGDDEADESSMPSAAQAAANEASKSLGTIHFGGPLSGPVVAVHNSSEHAEAETGRGVYVAAQRDVLETLVRQRPGPFRLIVGHLGWTVDQLKAEREAGLWHMIDATDEDVFVGDQDLWPSVIRRATTASLASWLGIPDTPMAGEVN